MAGLTMLLLFLLVSAVRSFHESNDGDLERKYAMVVNEVEDLRTTVTTMKEDMRRMKRVSRALDVLCEELRSGGDSQNTNSNVPETEQHGAQESGNDKTFKNKGEYTTLIQATSLQTNDDMFKLEYNSTVKAEVRVVDMSSLEKSTFNFNVVNSFSEGKGVVSGLIQDKQQVLLLIVEEYHSMLIFQKANNSNIILPRLTFTTDVRGDIVFDEGTSASIEVTMDKQDEFEFQCAMYAPSQNESETVMFIYENPEIVNLTDVKEYLNHQKLKVVVNDGKSNYEGVLFLSHRLESKHAGINLLSFTVSQSINVIKSGHSKPFPDRFLSFVVYPYREINTICEVGPLCTLSVTMMGDSPADITLWKLNDETKTQMDFLHRTIHFDHLLYAHFMIFNVSQSDAGLYMYRDTSHVGTVIEKKFEIKVDVPNVPYTILKDQSEVLEDTSEILVVRCVGKGDHDPQIRFYNSSHIWREITEGPGVSIQFSDEDNYTSSATLTIDRRTRSTNVVTCTVQEPGVDYSADSYEVYTKTDNH